MNFTESDMDNYIHYRQCNRRRVVSKYGRSWAGRHAREMAFWLIRISMSGFRVRSGVTPSLLITTQMAYRVRHGPRIDSGWATCSTAFYWLAYLAIVRVCSSTVTPTFERVWRSKCSPPKRYITGDYDLATGIAQIANVLFALTLLPTALYLTTDVLNTHVYFHSLPYVWWMSNTFGTLAIWCVCARRPSQTRHPTQAHCVHASRHIRAHSARNRC